MAYDEQLADRVRAVLATWRGVSEKRMFGGLTFLIDGHTCCGIVGDELMVCVGPLAYVTALAKRRAREMDFTGRPLRGYVCVAREGLRTDQAVRSWVEWGVTFTQSLPPKSPKRRQPRGARHPGRARLAPRPDLDLQPPGPRWPSGRPLVSRLRQTDKPIQEDR